ncbi:hypothetical protein DFH27DRAFT_523465 [Peziza echinospora]|nr:hypothetical protein DFH27DRAFT_523465 [Peziza echinospora]
MTSKRISLQLRTRAAGDSSPSQQQQQSEAHAREAAERRPQSTAATAAPAESAATLLTLKGRSSRLRPTVPLHMTTRRKKSVLETTQPPLHPQPPPPPAPAPVPVPPPTPSPAEPQPQHCSPTPQRPNPPHKPEMPPKRTMSSHIPEDEHPKKRLRGQSATSPSEVTPPEISQATNPLVVSDIQPIQFLQASQAPMKRPRGRPPSKLKAAALAEKNGIVQCAVVKEPSSLNTPEIKSAAASTAPSDIVHRKVPQKDVMEQYHRKQQLAFKHATTDQLRRRQARLQSHYFALAQLAKKNNALLVDKSIEILNNVNDIDLARTKWVGDILAGLEKREEARVEQIHFEKRVRMIDAHHTYTATKERILNEYDNRCVDARKKFLESASEEMSRLKRRYSPLDDPEEFDAVFSPQSTPQTYVNHNTATGGLDVLADLAGLQQQSMPPEEPATGIRPPTTSSIQSDTSSVPHAVRTSPS